MALMEYCLVNIVLGDSDGPKSAPEPPKSDRVFDLAARVRPDVLWLMVNYKSDVLSALDY